MPFVSKEDLQSRDRIDAQKDLEIADLQQRIVKEKVIGGVADLVRIELEKPESQLALEETAVVVAKVKVFDAERSRLTEEMSETIQRERYDEYAAEFRAHEGPAIRASLIEVFKADGTFRRLEDKAEKDVHAEIQDEVINQHKDKIREELSQPDKRAEIVAAVQAGIFASGEMDGYRQQVQEELEREWRADAEKLARQQVGQEEQSREETFIADYIARYTDSYQMRDYRTDMRSRLEKKWGKASLEKLQEAAVTEEERHIIEARIAQETALLHEKEKKAAAVAWLKEFEGLGTDSMQIDAGAKLTVFLGELKTFQIEKTKKDTWGYAEKHKVNVPGMVNRREIKMLALGEGRFCVEADSLATSESPYDRNASIPVGTVIVIGRRLSENGQEIFDRHISADSEFYYDDDTTTPAITNTHLTVGNIQIDGLFARDLEKIEHKN